MLLHLQQKCMIYIYVMVLATLSATYFGLRYRLNFFPWTLENISRNKYCGQLISNSFNDSRRSLMVSYNNETGNIRTNYVYWHGRNGQTKNSEWNNHHFQMAKPLFEFTTNVSSYPDKADFTKSVTDLPSEDEKLILFYTYHYNVPWFNSYWSPDGNLYFLDSPTFSCPRKCVFTHNRNMTQFANAIVFSVLDSKYHTRPGQSIHPDLKERRRDQLWIGATFEAPRYHNVEKLSLNYLFNWTASYRLDSDFYWPYGFFYKLDVPKPRSDIHLPIPKDLRKKKLAASLISNCGAPSQRNTVIDEMQRHVQVDTYGQCGKHKCPPDRDCRKFIAENYKFFLAFENSMCQDYITEKFFASFPLGIIPVVYGLGDYQEVAPPHSFVNVLDFPTVKQLTDHLRFLDRHDEEYLKYFYWKLEYEQGVVSMEVASCNLCRKIWEFQNAKKSTYLREGFHDWWNHKRALRQHPLRRNDTRGYTLLQQSTSACVRRPRALKRDN